MEKRCILFDFDGTLADTRDLAWKVLNELADEYSFRKLEPGDLDKVREMTKREFMKFLGVSKMKLPKLLVQGRAMMASHRGQQGYLFWAQSMGKRFQTLYVLSSGILVESN